MPPPATTAVRERLFHRTSVELDVKRSNAPLNYNTMLISINAQGDYIATVCGVKLPVLVDCHICTWVEAQASAMCKDPNVNLSYDECRFWIYKNWIA